VAVEAGLGYEDADWRRVGHGGRIRGGRDDFETPCFVVTRSVGDCGWVSQVQIALAGGVRSVDSVAQRDCECHCR
jgi:hypothetical protein